MVVRLCFLMTGNAQNAEDAAHTVFLSCCARGPVFKDEEHEKAFDIEFTLDALGRTSSAQSSFKSKKRPESHGFRGAFCF
ncbi:MAG: hypothetical protein LBD02_02960 [Christensenellaceae bacterium]|jgi:hypothetical protein|nr:hypothetical protein [Christensenellaceae bacterium]